MKLRSTTPVQKTYLRPQIQAKNRRVLAKTSPDLGDVLHNTPSQPEQVLSQNLTISPSDRRLKQVFKRFATTSFIIASAVVMTFSGITPVYAENYSDKINSIQRQIDSNQAEATKLGKQADSLQNAVNELQAQQNTIQAQIDLSQAKYDQLVQQIKDTEDKIVKNQDVLEATIGDLYINNQVSPIEMLASSKNIGDYLDQQEYRNSIRDRVESAITQIKKLKIQLEQKREESKKVLDEQKAQKGVLVEKQAEQANLLAQTQNNEASYQSRIGDLKKQRAVAEAALASSLSSRSYVNAVPAGRVNAGDVIGAVGSTGMSTGNHLHLEVRKGGRVVDPSPFIQSTPVSPAYISQQFGNPDPIYASGYHPGVDYAASYGTPIHAIQSGNMYRGCSQSLLNTWAYGYVAIVEQSDGSIALYAHMSGGPSGCSG